MVHRIASRSDTGSAVPLCPPRVLADNRPPRRPSTATHPEHAIHSALNLVRPPVPQLLHEIFERMPRSLPDRIAIDVPATGSPPRRRLTYGAADSLATPLPAPLAPPCP